MAIERGREIYDGFDELWAALADLHADWTGSPDALTRSIEFADFPTAVDSSTSWRRPVRSATTTLICRCAGGGSTSCSAPIRPAA